VQLVGVAHHLGGAARQGRTEDGLTERGPGGAGPEVVRGASDHHLDLARCVGPEQGVGHGRPGRRFRRCGMSGHGLDQVPAPGWAVAVEVVEDDQAGPGPGGSGQDALLEGRELLRPAGVTAGVEAERDAVCSCADARGEGEVGGVAGDDLSAR